MSEPTLTAEQQACADAIAARVAELTAMKGKMFVPKGKTFPVITIDGYGGTRDHQEFKDGRPIKVTSHVFFAHDSIGRRWTPPATQFLSEHEPAPETATETTTNEPI